VVSELDLADRQQALAHEVGGLAELAGEVVFSLLAELRDQLVR
jgi:hypothetical protein